MPQTIKRVRDLLDKRLTEVKSEIGHLTAVLDGLDGQAPSPGPQQPAASRRGPRAKRGERQRQFLETARANPKASIAEIGKTIGIGTQHASVLARKLEKAGQIKRGKQGIRVLAKTK